MNNTSISKPIIDESVITSAIEHLRIGDLVAFPTETVYGLGADASNEVALRKLYSVKGRPSDHPVIVHLSSAKQMKDWSIDLSDYAKKLAQHFWPGPLTLIVKKSPHVSSLVTGGQDTVGLRVPSHPIALALLEAFGGGIAAPSANKYGRVSSTCAQHVRDEFGDQVSLVIDGGNCPVGIESTIVDTTSSLPRVLRPGMISEKEIFEYLDLDSSSFDASPTSNHIRVPGSDKIHYAPRTPLWVLDKVMLKEAISDSYSPITVLAFEDLDKLSNNRPNFVRKYIQAAPDPKLYAQNLYDNLRQLDACAANRILVEAVPGSIEWLAVADRLNRASLKL